jgi:spermidine synthase
LSGICGEYGGYLKLKKRLYINFTLFGLISILAQVGLFRGLLNLTGGNELTIVIAFGGWFIGQTIGNLIAIFFGRDRKTARRWLFTSLMILSVLIPLSIILIQVFHISMGLTTGEVANLGVDSLASLIFITPVAILLGGIFTLGCKVSYKGVFAVPSVYIFEGVGSAIGGLVATFSLEIMFNTLLLGILTTIISVITAVSVLLDVKSRFIRITAFVLSSVILVVSIGGMIDGYWSELYDDIRDRFSYPEFELIDTFASRYGEISLVRNKGGLSVYQSGSLISSYPDEFNLEETIYLPILLHPHPEDILIVGGGPGGEVEFVLEFPLKRVVLCQKDETLVNISREYMSVIPEDERLGIVNEDPVRYLDTTDDKFDVIILNVGEPSTAETNRYYTVDFLWKCKRRLKDGGMVVNFATSDENYIGPDMADYLKSLFITYQKVFFYVKYIPGAKVIFVLTDEKMELIPENLVGRIVEYEYSPEYFDENYIKYRLQQGRCDTFKIVLRNASGVVNTYDKPIAYYFDLLLWTSKTSPSLRDFFRFNRESGDWWFVSSVGFIILLIILSRRRISTVLKASIFIGGFTAITFEIILIVLYQSLLGDVYRNIALIFADFMIGLSAGSFIIAKYLSRRRMTIAVAYIIFFVLLAILTLHYFLIPNIILISHFRAINIIIYLSIFIVSSCVGGLFSVVSVIKDWAGIKAGRIGGVLHSLDTLGALLGSVYASLIALPVSGAWRASTNIGLLSGGILVIALFVFMVKRRQ